MEFARPESEHLYRGNFNLLNYEIFRLTTKENILSPGYKYNRDELIFLFLNVQFINLDVRCVCKKGYRNYTCYPFDALPSSPPGQNIKPASCRLVDPRNAWLPIKKELFFLLPTDLLINVTGPSISNRSGFFLLESDSPGGYTRASSMRLPFSCDNREEIRSCFLSNS